MLRRRALDLVRQNTSTSSLSIKLKRAGWDVDVLRSILTNIAKAKRQRRLPCRSIAALAETTQAHVIAGLPASTVPITEHRRNHRPGRPAILDTDPELRAFVLARIDRLTFDEIEAEITLQYLVERRVKKSELHACWKKTCARHPTTSNAQQ